MSSTTSSIGIVLSKRTLLPSLVLVIIVLELKGSSLSNCSAPLIIENMVKKNNIFIYNVVFQSYTNLQTFFFFIINRISNKLLI